MMMIGELVDDVIDQLRTFEPVRYPVLNQEPRVQLEPRLWHLIHERDGGECWVCHRPVAKGAGEIDHLIPRSSFPPGEVVTVADRSWNLRLACVACNQAKSNFTVPVLPRTFGVTSRCWDCLERREMGRPDPEWWPELASEWRDECGVEVELTVQAYCGSCGLVSWVPDDGWIL